MKIGRVKGGSIIPATIDTGRRFRSNMAQPIRNMAGSPRGIIGGAARNIIEITSDDLVQNGGQYELMGGPPIPMQIVMGRRSKQGAAQVVYPVDVLGNYDPTFAGYIYKVLTADEESGYDPSGLIGFWPQNELAGGVSFDHSGFDHHGAYTAVNLGQPGVPGMGMSSAGYDGATSYNNIYSVAMAGAFDGEEGTWFQWIKVGAGVWGDAALRASVSLYGSAGNQIYILKHTTDNLQFVYIANTVNKTVMVPCESVSWLPIALRWSLTEDTVKAYVNGGQAGATQVGLGVWGFPLSATRTLIGALTQVPQNVFSRNLGPGALWKTALPDESIAYVSERPLKVAVFFGDSIIAGTGASGVDAQSSTLISIGKEWYTTTNSGAASTVLQNTVQNTVAVIGGSAVNNGRDTYVARVLAHNPTDVVILYGLNDLRLSDVAFSDVLFQNDLGEVVDALIAGGVPGQSIIIGSPPFISDYTADAPIWNSGTAPKQAAYTAACAAVAASRGTRYADVYQAMIDGGGPALISGDGVHPNDAGHAVIATSILAAV